MGIRRGGASHRGPRKYGLVITLLIAKRAFKVFALPHTLIYSHLQVADRTAPLSGWQRLRLPPKGVCGRNSPIYVPAPPFSSAA